MKETMIVLATILLILYVRPLHLEPTPSSLPELDESQVKAHWLDAGEPAPFSGILLNDYTYERLRLKIIELGG